MSPRNPDRTLSALISLLDEPDENAFRLIRERIVSQGKEAIPALERNLDREFNEVILERTQMILRAINNDMIAKELMVWVESAKQDLFQAFCIITRSRFPSLDVREMDTRLEKLKVDIWLELNDEMTALERVKVMNRILFDLHHFEANRSDLTDIRNHHLHTLLETRKGSPVTLGMLYMILARKVGLPIFGVDLPQHFILAYMSGVARNHPGEEEVLFYINPFNKGSVFTRREIETFVTQMKIRPEPSFFTPCTSVNIVRRLIGNLIHSYTQTGDNERAEEMKTLLTILE